jgi:peptide/nickel transport system permease protein
MRLIKITERLLAAFPLMIGVAVVVFIFMRLTPGDPVDVMMGQGGAVSQGEVERLCAEFNLDKSIHEQLLLFLGGLARGDMGNSFSRQQPVARLIGERLPATIELALGAMFFALLIAFPIGIISAVRQNSMVDRVSMGTAFLGISMPSFWLGIVLIMLFSVRLRWLPVQGRIDYDAGLQTVTGFYVLDSLLTGNMAALKSSIRHLILPSIALGAGVAAIVARVLRSSLLEALRSDYVKLARAKGASENRVVMKHALRNALIPTVTVVGLQVGVLLGGNMIIETVFGWPGLGRLVVDSIFNRDFPLVQGAVLVYAFTFIIANLAVDVLYTFLNPKIEM